MTKLTLKELFEIKKYDIIELEIPYGNKYHLFIQALDEHGGNLYGKFDLQKFKTFCVEIIENKYDVVGNIYKVSLDTNIIDLITKAIKIIKNEKGE